MIARMWEVRATEAGFDELLSWVCDRAVPQVSVDPRHVSSEIFTSPDLRVVVISKWRSDPVPLPDPPPHLVARAPHSWDFTPVDR